jgi:hypothetical protein
VQLIQVDAGHVEGPAARLAGSGEVTRAAVRHPLSTRPRQATFGRHRDARTIAAPHRESARNQPFVVTDLVRVEAVGVGGVQKSDASVERGVDDGDRACLVALGGRREAHAADTDHGIADCRLQSADFKFQISD